MNLQTSLNVILLIWPQWTNESLSHKLSSHILPNLSEFLTLWIICSRLIFFVNYLLKNDILLFMIEMPPNLLRVLSEHHRPCPLHMNDWLPSTPSLGGVPNLTAPLLSIIRFIILFITRLPPIWENWSVRIMMISWHGNAFRITGTLWGAYQTMQRNTKFE